MFFDSDGLKDSLCPLHLFCSLGCFSLSLRYRLNTRYGWVANPYLTGTFTPQDVSDLSRHDDNKFSQRLVRQAFFAYENSFMYSS